MTAHNKLTNTVLYCSNCMSLRFTGLQHCFVSAALGCALSCLGAPSTWQTGPWTGRGPRSNRRPRRPTIPMLSSLCPSVRAVVAAVPLALASRHPWHCSARRECACSTWPVICSARGLPRMDLSLPGREGCRHIRVDGYMPHCCLGAAGGELSTRAPANSTANGQSWG